MTAPRQGALATPHILRQVATPAGEQLTVMDAILQIIRAGGTRKQAAIWANVAPSTLSKWITRGLATWEQLDNNHDNPEKQATAIENPDDPYATCPEPERPYLQLAMGVAQGEVAYDMRLVTSLSEHAKTDWRAALEVLRSRERGTWNTTPRVEVTGPGGGPIAHGVVTFTRDSFEAKVAELEERRARALDVGEAAYG